MPYPEIGQPMPRAADAYARTEKWRGWILAAQGHGPEWARVLELRDGDTAMVEITTPKLGPAARIVFVPIEKLRRVV